MARIFQERIQQYQEMTDGTHPSTDIEDLQKAYKELEGLYLCIDDEYSKHLTPIYNEMFSDLPHYMPFQVICDASERTISFSVSVNATDYETLQIKMDIRKFNKIDMRFPSLSAELTEETSEIDIKTLLFFEIYNRIISDSDIKKTICRDIPDMHEDRRNMRVTMRNIKERINRLNNKSKWYEAFNNLENMEYIYIRLISEAPESTYVRIREYDPNKSIFPEHMLLHNDRPCHICPEYGGVFMSTDEDKPAKAMHDPDGCFTDIWVRKSEIKEPDGSTLF